MTWATVQLGYRFFFQEQCFDGVIRDKLQRTIRMLTSLDDPTTYDGLYSCPVHHGRHVAKVIDSKLLLFFQIHYDDDPKPDLQHSIELIAIIDPAHLNE